MSQLKYSQGSQQVSAALPSDLTGWYIIQCRWTSDDRSLQEQGLVQWWHLPTSLSTLDPLAQLCQQFPHASAWGHADSEYQGSVNVAASTA